MNASYRGIVVGSDSYGDGGGRRSEFAVAHGKREAVRPEIIRYRRVAHIRRRAGERAVRWEGGDRKCHGAAVRIAARKYNEDGGVFTDGNGLRNGRRRTIARLHGAIGGQFQIETDVGTGESDLVNFNSQGVDAVNEQARGDGAG